MAPSLAPCPELKAGFAALPSQKSIQIVKKWQQKILQLTPDDYPLISDDVPPPANNESNNNDDGKKKKKKQRTFDWRELAKFDIAMTLQILSELDVNYVGSSSSKEDDDDEETKDELRYGALKRAISRYDERPGKCFTFDILLGILNAAANCYDILLPKPKNNNNSGNDATAVGEDDSNGSPPPSPSAAQTPQSRKPKNSPPINTMMIGASHVLLTKLQCYCIMACSFLNIFPRVNNNCSDITGQLPSINLGEMFELDGGHVVGISVHVEKLLMFFEYYAVCSKRVYKDADPKMVSDRFGVIFVRGITPKNIPPFGDAKFRDCPLSDLSVMELQKSIDDQKHTLRIDFANAMVGGASLAFGCVQEEITFAECPEMNCSRWMNPPMDDNEAILILRCEQFASHAGYGHGLIYQGPHTDYEANVLNSAVIAVDAYDYRYGTPSTQFQKKSIEREFNKLCAAMDACQVARVVYGAILPSTVCTGNWGCGVFRGDAELKALTQWLAFSVHGLKVLYCPFDNAGLQQRLKDISICCNARKEKLSCAQLGEFLAQVSALVSNARGNRGGSSSQQQLSICTMFAQYFNLDLAMAGENLRSPPSNHYRQ